MKRDIGTALLFDGCSYCWVFLCVCVVVFWSLPLHQSLPLFWVSTRHQRPGISWLPVCQCRPWPWPAGWCCRCGNVVPPTGPGSQRLGSLWMQRNSCVCREEQRRRTQKQQWATNEMFLLNQAHKSQRAVLHLLCTNGVLGKPFQTIFYCTTASCNSVNVKFYCVLYCYILICCCGALSKKMIKGIRTQPSS